MIPYWHFSQFHIGPIPVNTWGFVVSLGFGVAIFVAYRRARRLGLDGNKLLDLAFWIIIAAIVGARLGHVFFYEWGYFSKHLGEIIRIDQGGLSSFGGFIGAVAAFWGYGRLRLWRSPSPQPSPAGRGGLNASPLPLASGSESHPARRGEGQGEGAIRAWRYADLLMFVWPLGHGIGRIGCFLTHMHPGRLSNVPWAVQYPGGARLDMGLIEAIGLLVYWFIGLLFLNKRPHFTGFYVVAGMIFYGAARLVLDFFRATDIAMADARYFGLTPAQYGSVVLIIFGIYIYARRLVRA